MIEAAIRARAEVAARGCASWQAARLPSDAIPLDAEHVPPAQMDVLGWASCPGVSIWYCPVVVRRDGHLYWVGLPGNWIELTALNWVLTHWRAM